MVRRFVCSRMLKNEVMVRVGPQRHTGKKFTVLFNEIFKQWAVNIQFRHYHMESEALFQY